MMDRTISHYTILEKPGEGGMGVVYRARDIRPDRIAALKLLPADSSLETSQIPMFNLFNMPESRKRKVVFEAGHSVPRVESARKVLDWLDRYPGPVR